MFQKCWSRFEPALRRGIRDPRIAVHQHAGELQVSPRSPAHDRAQVPATHQRIEQTRRSTQVSSALSKRDLPTAGDRKTMPGGGAVDPSILLRVCRDVVEEALILFVLIVVPEQVRVALAEISK